MPNTVIKIIGRKTYNMLVKKHGLCTKKWTAGRTKEFYKEVTKILAVKMDQMGASNE